MSVEKAVVLVSGGLDSTTCLAIAQNNGYELYAMSVHYGQKHQAELTAARHICQQYQVKQHKFCLLYTSPSPRD